jgi:hypothetical protein
MKTYPDNYEFDSESPDAEDMAMCTNCINRHLGHTTRTCQTCIEYQEYYTEDI